MQEPAVALKWGFIEAKFLPPIKSAPGQPQLCKGQAPTPRPVLDPKKVGRWPPVCANKRFQLPGSSIPGDGPTD